MHSIPMLNQMCSHKLKTVNQIASTLSRIEYKCLWSAEAPTCLSKETMQALLHEKIEMDEVVVKK